MSKKIILLWACMVVSIALQAAPYRFKHISGLPHQQVESIVQDKQGNIWIGTRNGLCRYDGYEMKTYYHQDNNPHSLIHNFIHHLFVDDKGRLWVCTEIGICRYRPKSDDFEHFNSPRSFFGTACEKRNGDILFGGDVLLIYDEASNKLKEYPTLNNGKISSMVVDKNDRLYVSTNNAIFFFDAKMSKITLLDKNYYADCLTSSNAIMPLFIDSKNRIWIGQNGNGLLCISNKKATLYAPRELSNGIVRTITEDQLHNMWIGTEKGITLIRPNGQTDVIQHQFNDYYSLSDNAIYTILCDKKNNIWIGSYFGGVDLLLHNNRQFQHFEPGALPRYIKARVPRMMSETQPGVIWIATEDAGINIYDRNKGTFASFTDILGLGSNIHALHYDKKHDEMWIGTRFQGLYIYNLKTRQYKHYYLTNGLNSEGVFYLAQQQNGIMWIATMEGLRWYDRENNSFRTIGKSVVNSTFVYTLCIDKNDNIWAGTTNHGIYVVNGKTAKTINITQGVHSGLKDNYIISLFQDSKGTMWVGTNNNGLQRYNAKTRKIEAVNGDIQLSQSTICSINEDKRGTLWISTGQGVYEYNRNKQFSLRYSFNNDLSINQFNFSSSLFTSTGILLLGTINGLIAFNPYATKFQAGPYPVHWKELTVNSRPVTTETEDSPLTETLDNTSLLTLSYSQARSFYIEYGVIIPGNTENIQYQVWIKGIDKSWRNVGSERRFYGYNMQPGTYDLMVRANNSNIRWEQCPVKTLRIVIEPPFYRSTMASIIYLLLIATAAWIAYRLFNIRMQEKNAVKIATLEKEKIEAIDKAKFDFFTTVSHELKTPLSLIVAPLKSIAQSQLPLETRTYVDMATKHAKKMESLISELITFNKVETDNLPFYLQKGNPLEFIKIATRPFHQTVADKGLIFLVDCEDNGEEVWFSPSYLERILFNLLSNALKFTSKGRISIKALITTDIHNNDTYLQLKVSDTGIGIAPEELDSIFTRFYQTKRGYNANNSGWGIGLALIKRLAELHHGSVSVKSEQGMGTTFTVLLNVSPNAFDDSVRITTDTEIVPVTKYEFTMPGGVDSSQTVLPSTDQGADVEATVLLIDDNIDILEYLSSILQGKYNVKTASNGQQGLELAQEGGIDLIISDIMMPGMDGYELCHRIKTNMETSHIPIILLTAKTENEDVVTGYKSGAEAYITKPFDPQILELQINNILQLLDSRRKDIVEAQGEVEAPILTELDKQFINKINKLVDENIGNSDFAILDITQNIGVSRSLLHTKMKILMGISMGDYIRKKRIEKACHMLRDGYNVSETAYSTGFADPNYFSKAFKKHMNMSPSEYANQTNYPK